MGGGVSGSKAGSYRFGVLCLVAAAFFTSLAGVLLRHVEAADGWQILFYRSLAFVATMAVFIGWRHGRGTPGTFRAIGLPGLAVAGFLATAFMLFIFALLDTTVANVVFTVSLSPFLAAGMGWLAMREAVAPGTLAAMVVALVGVGVMFSDGLAIASMSGNLLALACCFCYSATLVAMRKGRAADMMPAVCLAGVIALAVAATMAPGLAIGAFDLGIAVTLGVVQLAFQYILVTTGTRSVPAAEVALIGRLTLVLAPLWVWLAVDEVPGSLTMIGGAVVVGAVLTNSFSMLRRERRLSVPAGD